MRLLSVSFQYRSPGDDEFVTFREEEGGGGCVGNELGGLRVCYEWS